MFKVLIVDDSEEILYMLQVLLESNGYEVIMAKDGAEALEKAMENPPDLIVSDVLMPVMDGFALCRYWKSDEKLKSIPFIFYSATYTNDRDRELAMSLGAERYIVKPVEPESFLKILQEVIDDHWAGKIVSTRVPVMEETVYYRKYNEALIRKLEDSLVALEKANRTLERDIAERKHAEEALRESERRFRAIFEQTFQFIGLMTLDGTLIKVNRTALELIGSEESEVIGKPFWETPWWTHSAQQQQELRDAVKKAAEGEFVRFEATHISADGGLRYIDFSLKPVTDEAGRIILLIPEGRDITERRQAERAIQEREQKYRTILDNIDDGYQEVDLTGNIIFFNDSILKMLGYSRDEFAKKNYRDFVNEETSLQLFHIFNEVYETGTPYRGLELEIKRKDGSIRNVEVSVSLIRDAKDHKEGFSNFIRDVTERKRSEETIRRLAYHDPLTSLPNRLLFSDRLNMAIARANRNRQYLAVMLLDLDNFKDINDTLGHDVGDQLLQSTGQRMTGLLRKGDTIARMGGDEFLLLLPEIQNIEDTVRIASKIIETFEIPFVIENHRLQITTSIGIAIYPKDSDDVDTLLKHADIAMYRAKASGRNNYQLFSHAPVVKT